MVVKDDSALKTPRTSINISKFYSLTVEYQEGQRQLYQPQFNGGVIRSNLIRRTWKIITLPVLSWLNSMPANKGRLLQGGRKPPDF